MPEPVSAPPSVVSVTPSSGSGSTQTFSAVFSDPNGYANMTWGYFLVNYDLTGWGGCWIQFSPTSLWLYSDPVTGWQGPVAIGSSTTLQNSVCSVPAASASVSGSGKTLTFNVTITFKPVFVGPKKIYLEISNAAGLTSGWQQQGAWTPPGTDSAPQVVSATPSSGTGSAQTFSFVATDANGYSDITWEQVVFNYDVTGWGACWVYFSASSNRIWLNNDAGNNWQTAANLGSSTTLQNSQCTIQVANSSFSGSGNNLTLNLSITFKCDLRRSEEHLHASLGRGRARQRLAASGHVDGSRHGRRAAGGFGDPVLGRGSTQVFTFAASHPDGL